MITTAEAFRKYTDPETFARIRSDGTVSAMWERCSREFAGCTAVIWQGEEHTFARLEEDAAHFRAALRLAGVSKGDRVALLAVNSYEFVKGWIAAVTMGCTAVVLPAQLPAPAVVGCCLNFRAKALLWRSEQAAKAQAVAAKAPHVLSVPLDTVCDAADPVAACAPADGCTVMFTGGTSGKSKGVLLSHRAVTEGTVNGCYGYPDVFNQRYLLVLPLSHVFGLIRNMLTSLFTGSALVICADNKDMFRDIAVYRPTMLVAVPALAEMALSLSRKLGRNMLGDSVKAIICGAAAVPDYLVRAYHDIGIALYPGYGLTETANLVSGNPETLAKPGSVGLPYPNQEIRFVDGEIWLKGDNLLTAYVGEEREAFEDGWFRTGDLGRLDEDGFLYITGRCKEVIVLPSGENISPAELESVFDSCELVMASQVFEDVDENGRHFLSLEVVPRAAEMAKVTDGNPGEVLTRRLWELNGTLPEYARVAKIAIRTSDFDRTPSMKIVRYKKC